MMGAEEGNGNMTQEAVATTDEMAGLAALSIQEEVRLAALEETIDRGIRTFVEVGSALMEIRDGRLYRERYATFEDYCRERWAMVASRARQLIGASVVVANLESVTTVTPESERQARPLAALEPDQQREAWKQAVETAPAGKVTAAHVAATVAKMNGEKEYVLAPDPPPPPRTVEVDSQTRKRAADSRSQDKMQEGRIRRPFEVEGKLYVVYMNDDVAVRVWPADDWPGKPVESHRKLSELNKPGYYYHGWKVFYGATGYVVDHRDRIKVVEASAPDGEQAQPAYVPIYQLEQGIRDYLAWNSRALNTELSFEDNKLILVEGFDGLRSSGFLPKPWRKGDVRQAVNNVLDQLRQEQRRQQAARLPDSEEEQPTKDRLAVHYSSASTDWETPQWLFNILDQEFHFEVDVCATSKNAKVMTYFSPDLDGLAQPWYGTCWMNPPYDRKKMKLWVRKAYMESRLNGATVVCLLPARTDTSWWWDYCIEGEIRFLKGRLRFGDAENGAPFPSAVVVFGPGVEKKVVWWQEGSSINGADV
jgi:phage N-6-adenine-methyltransferase